MPKNSLQTARRLLMEIEMQTVWNRLFVNLLVHGHETSPRGEPTKELLGYTCHFDNPATDVYHLHPARKLNLSYTCFEWLWYLRGMNSDLSITERASIWKYLSERGVLQSNYGQYIFREGQLDRCQWELTNDPNSRRAVIMILRPNHFGVQSADTPCTLGISFLIRDKKLVMHVMMRSNDAVFGLGNDAPNFAWTQRLLLDRLRTSDQFADLELGPYVHTASSMHVYKRHWLLAKQLMAVKPHTTNPEPAPQDGEMDYLAALGELIDLRRLDRLLLKIPESYHWARWLVSTAMEGNTE
jgi:thymidylate synthase